MRTITRLLSIVFFKRQSEAENFPNKLNSEVSREDILKFASRYKTPEPQPAKIALNKLLNRIDSSIIPVYRKPERRIQSAYVSIAASIILLLGLSIFFLNRKNLTTLITTQGQQVSIYLPDSSEVIINASSIIRYKSKQWKANRTVELEGEAFFRVKKGSRFEIHSKRGITTVLGTSFNVYARDKNYKVSCFTGKVSVRTNNNSSAQLITPGYETRLEGNNVLAAPYKFNTQDAAMWQKGEFYFHDESLKNVFDEIERQFNVTIEASDIKERNFTGCFFRNNIQQALKLVCEPMQLDYSIKGNTIIINNKVSK
jgi:ferric-dicitrate binding protein FerR (iron transport regulator)